MARLHLCGAVCAELGLPGADGRHSVSVDDRASAADGFSVLAGDGPDGWCVKEEEFLPEMMQKSVAG